MTSDDTASHGALTRLVIDGLFSRFNYDIEFNEEDLLTILISPNGFGKTTILRIINNILTANFRYFSGLSFGQIELYLSNGLGIRITKRVSSDITPEAGPSSAGEVCIAPIDVSMHNEEFYTYDVGRDDKLSEAIERYLPVHRVDTNHWLDTTTNSIMSSYELVSRFEGLLPTDISSPKPLPQWLRKTCSSTHCHFIETERLLSLELEEGSLYSYRRGAVKSESVVEKDAADLSDRIRRVVNAYATESQKRDQTFPKRIIENRGDRTSDEASIRKRLRLLGEKQDQLVDAGLIEEPVGEPISHSDDLSDENIRNILSIYIDDTEKKLSVFDDIYERARLFKTILNEHFFFTKIGVDQHNGITASDVDSSTSLRLSELSSGEQHELVLMYELLFIVRERAVILIDEPELSLHVAWQRRFVQNLREIQRLRKVQFVIATHSPQIIGDQWNLTTELQSDE